MPRYLMPVIVVIILGWGLSACSANAPTTSTCERKCGSRPVSGGKLVVLPLNNDYALQCAPVSTTTVLTEVEFNFLVYDDISSTAGSTNSGNSASDRAEAGTPKRVPKGGVAFHPNIMGIVGPGGERNTVTPSSEWCTDSCGIATMRIQLVCAYQELNVGIIPAGLTGEATQSTGNPLPASKVTISKLEL